MKSNAYHFTGDTLRDGSPIPPIGETLVHTGPLELCASGYHASRKVWQALNYARGTMLHRVHCGGRIINDVDKLVCTERTIVASINAESLLREYARKCALDVIHLWDAPDVVREWLENGDEALREEARAEALAAREAARDAATWEAARAATWEAAWAAAAREAAWAAAAATWEAAWAARAAARAAAAAREAAWAAGARDVRTKQRARLTLMINAAFEAQS